MKNGTSYPQYIYPLPSENRIFRARGQLYTGYNDIIVQKFDSRPLSSLPIDCVTTYIDIK